jgi:hypothetical protein
MGRFSVLAAVYIVLYIYNVPQPMVADSLALMDDRQVPEGMAGTGVPSMQPPAVRRQPDQRIAEDLKMFVMRLSISGCGERDSYARFVCHDPVAVVGHFRIQVGTKHMSSRLYGWVALGYDHRNRPH